MPSTSPSSGERRTVPRNSVTAPQPSEPTSPRSFVGSIAVSLRKEDTMLKDTSINGPPPWAVSGVMRKLLFPILILLILYPASARAQVGSATDIITGVITTEDGPVQDATIQAYSLETQITRTARTDARGRFTILFPDGGGQYRMTVRAVGMNPRIEMIQRHADEDRLVWNVRVVQGTVQISAINVTSGPQITRAPEGPTPGSSERNFTDAQLSRLPTDASDLALLASLVPGVVSIGATD